MPDITSVCPVCGKEYINYYPEGYVPWCSLECQYAEDGDDQESEGD